MDHCDIILSKTPLNITAWSTWGPPAAARTGALAFVAARAGFAPAAAVTTTHTLAAMLRARVRFQVM